MGLGIDSNGFSLIQISAIVDINVTNAIQVFDHWHAGIFTDPLDQPLAATRHNHVNIVRHGNQCAHRRAVGGLHHLHNFIRQADRCQSSAQALGNGTIGVNRL